MNNEMSPEMSKQISSILTWLEESARSAQGFAIEQAPLVAQEIVKWELVSSIISMSIIIVIGVSLFMVGIWAVKKGKKQQEELRELHKQQHSFRTREETSPFLIFGLVAKILSSLVLIIGISVNASSIVKTQTAPRLVIIDYVKNFNKNPR